MPYTPPDRHGLQLHLVAGGYAPPDRHALRLHIARDAVRGFSTQGQSAEAQGRARPPLRRVLFAQTTAGWQVASPLALECRAAFRDGEALAAERQAGIAPGTPADLAVGLAWGSTVRADGETRTAWGLPSPYAHEGALPWRRPGYAEIQAASGWQQARGRSGLPAALPWGNPPAHDREAALAWRVARKLALEARLRWEAGIALAAQRRLPWGQALGVPWVLLPLAPTAPNPPGPPACYLPPQRHALRLGLLRRAYTPPERQALALHLICGPSRRFDVRETLAVSHSLSVVRLPDRLSLPVRSVAIAASRDSWAWTLDVEFASASALTAVEPSPTGMATIEITLNGYVFVGLLENLSESRRLNQRRGSGRCRSLTAVMAAPYQPERGYSNPEPATAQQLALRELEFSGTALDWQLGFDWTLPPGAWSYERETPLSAILRIAEAAGAMVQSHPVSQTLIVAPRLKAAPWAWDAETPDFSLAGGSWLSLGRSYTSGGRYNGAVISGREQGINAIVYRDGTLGSPYAQQIVDQLNTDSQPARARGMGIIADSLDRHEMPVELPLTPAPQAPGLLLPGELGEVVDTVWGNYRAVVHEVRLTASADERGLVTARQNATLWRHLP